MNFLYSQYLGKQFENNDSELKVSKERILAIFYLITYADNYPLFWQAYLPGIPHSNSPRIRPEKKKERKLHSQSSLQLLKYIKLCNSLCLTILLLGILKRWIVQVKCVLQGMLSPIQSQAIVQQMIHSTDLQRSWM